MRFSESDFEKIKAKAESAGMDMTGYITSASLNKKIMRIDGLADAIKALKGIGRNLNQLTTLCNMGKIQCLELSTLKKDFGTVFEYLYNLTERS